MGAEGSEDGWHSDGNYRAQTAEEEFQKTFSLLRTTLEATADGI